MRYSIQNERRQERTQRRQPRPARRRTGTRAAAVRLALQEA